MARSSSKSGSPTEHTIARHEKLLRYLLKRRRRLLQKADRVESDISNAEKDIERGARSTDHRFRL